MAHRDLHRRFPPFTDDDEFDGPDDALAGLHRPGDGFSRLLSDLTSGGASRWLADRPGRFVWPVLGVVAVVAGAWFFLRSPSAPVEATLPMAGVEAAASGASSPGASSGASGTPAEGSLASASSASSTSTTEPVLVVQAAGAVARSGVFRLPPGARVDDVVRAAGGFATDADVDRVNLAAPVSDGERVWVPRRGELAAPEVVAGAGGGSPATASPSGSSGAATAGGGAAGGEAPPTVVNLNTATAADLDTLPGVGPATATSILAYRDEHGPFGAVDDLLEVRGIGDAKLEQLRPLVTV